MVLAKVAVAVIALVLLPALASLPWWLWCGFTWRQAALGFGEYAIGAGMISVSAAFVACWCDSLSRAFLWGVLGVPLIAGYENVTLVQSVGSLQARVALVGIAAGGLLLVIVAQYSWRRLTRSFAVLASVVTVFLVAQHFVGNPPTKTLVPGWDRSAELASAVRAEYRGAYREPIRIGGEKRIQVVAGFYTPGVPDGLAVWAQDSQQSWRYSDGSVTRCDPTTISHHGVSRVIRALNLSFVPFRPAPDPAQWRKFPQVGHADVSMAPYSTSVYLRESVADRIACESPSFAAELRFGLVRPKLVAEIPVETGRRMVGEGVSARILAATASQGGVDFDAIKTNGDLLMLTWTESYLPPFLFFLHMPGSTGVVPDSSRNLTTTTINSVQLSYVKSSWPAYTGGKIAAETDSAKPPHLGYVSLEEVARFTRTVEVPSFHFLPDRSE